MMAGMCELAPKGRSVGIPSMPSTSETAESIICLIPYEGRPSGAPSHSPAPLRRSLV